MEESKIKHLEMIQAVVTRMGGNLFLLKGWSTTLIVGLVAIIGKDLNMKNLMFSFVILFVFWILDGYFLSLERCFRALYDDVRQKSEQDIDFSMSIGSFRNGRNTWIRSIASKTLLIFYGSLFAAMLGITLLSVTGSIHVSIDVGQNKAQEEVVNK